MKRKLILKSQTLRVLSSRDLATAVAGEAAISAAWCQTQRNCPPPASDGFSCGGNTHD